MGHQPIPPALEALPRAGRNERITRCDSCRLREAVLTVVLGGRERVGAYCRRRCAGEALGKATVAWLEANAAFARRHTA